MSKKYIKNGIFYYFAWGNKYKEYFFNVIDSNLINHVVLFGPEEHEIGYLFCNLLQFRYLIRYLEQRNITYEIVVSANLDPVLNSPWPYKNQKHILSWDSYFAFQTLEYNLHNNVKSFGYNKNISKHFISLNARSHPWRCMFVDYLYKEGLFDHGYVSWHNSENWDYDYKFKYWTPEIINFDQNWLSNTDGILNIMYPPKQQFQDSLFSVISESHDQVLKITEKTYLPIYHKRPFIVHGAQYFHKMLKDQGFELFDEIFNYDFDQMPNDYRVHSKDIDCHFFSEERCQAMIHETKKILDYDPNELYKILKPKIEHNFNNLFNLCNKQNVDKRIVQLVANINKFNNTNYQQILNVEEHPNLQYIRG